MEEINLIINKYKNIINGLKIKGIKYELELILFYKNVKCELLKQENSTLYFQSDNLDNMYRIINQLNCYNITIHKKENYITIFVDNSTVVKKKKRIDVITNIVKEIFNNEISSISKKINSSKKKFKDMSDNEISEMKKNNLEIDKVKKEFVNIIKKLSV